MTLFLVAALVLAADPTPEQLKLLQTFRAEFVTIAPGSAASFPAKFSMGRAAGGDDSERPAREVALKHKFAIAKYEVPQNLWEALLKSNPSRWKGARNSVEMLSYDEAQAFCEQATTLMRAAKLIEPHQVVRLPSEAEWEYCARAGTTTVYSFGDDDADINLYAWHTGNAAGNDPPVGAKKPNAYGLYDMHGYLWEWCLDDWHDSYQDAPIDGRPWLDKDRDETPSGVLRGGSWKDKSTRCTSTSRQAAKRSTRDDAVGLRCVLE